MNKFEIAKEGIKTQYLKLSIVQRFFVWLDIYPINYCQRMWARGTKTVGFTYRTVLIKGKEYFVGFEDK